MEVSRPLDTIYAERNPKLSNELSLAANDISLSLDTFISNNLSLNIINTIKYLRITPEKQKKKETFLTNHVLLFPKRVWLRGISKFCYI